MFREEEKTKIYPRKPHSEQRQARDAGQAAANRGIPPKLNLDRSIAYQLEYNESYKLRKAEYDQAGITPSRLQGRNASTDSAARYFKKHPNHSEDEINIREAYIQNKLSLYFSKHITSTKEELEDYELGFREDFKKYLDNKYHHPKKRTNEFNDNDGEQRPKKRRRKLIEVPSVPSIENSETVTTTMTEPVTEPMAQTHLQTALLETTSNLLLLIEACDPDMQPLIRLNIMQMISGIDVQPVQEMAQPTATTYEPRMFQPAPSVAEEDLSPITLPGSRPPL